MEYKQVRVDEHVTPQHDDEYMRNSFINAMHAHYGHCFRVCKYCGWYRHRDYVCSCGVDTTYLEDENGANVREDGELVEAYLVPERGN